MIGKQHLLADAASALAPLSRAHHVPGYLHASPEVYALEKEVIFMKEWLCIGREEEIERSGDYLALRIVDEPIIVCRDDDGRLNGFYNVCAHRGTEVVMRASGSDR